jgi:hypothetical protein
MEILNMTATVRIALKSERDALAHAARAYALAQNFGRVRPLENALAEIDRLLAAYGPQTTGPWVLCRSRRRGGGIVSMFARAKDAALYRAHQLAGDAPDGLHLLTHADYGRLDSADADGNPDAPARIGGKRA